MYSESYHPGTTVARVVGLTIAGIIGAVIIAFLFGYFVMLLWNWLLPPLFHVGTIGYWQAFGLVILAKILFGGFGHGHDHYSRRRDWRREARNWEHWGRAAGPCDWETRDEWVPKGSYRNWRHYGQYWKDEGRAAFEAWLDRHEKRDRPSEGEEDKGPGQPKAE
jgi:hypothetical protein